MRKYLYIILIAITLAVSIAGCSRIKGIASDINWIVFDGEPSREH